MLQNTQFLKALNGEPTDYTPIWLMRQAGRYLPEYRQIRAQAGSFMNLCQNPELACEVTMQPLRRFDLDAAILFSDILTIPDAMGLGLHFIEGEGPKFEDPIRQASDIEKLPIVEPEDKLTYVTDAVSLIRKTLNNQVPLIGFAGSPWTLACYMVEGQSSRDFKQVKHLMYEAPALMHSLLDKLARSIVLYLNAQIEAGAQTIMIFDTWGGILTTHDYQQFSLDYMQLILSELLKEKDGVNIPKIIFTKGGGQWLQTIAKTDCDAIGIDWTTSLAWAKTQVGNKVLQGNLDPALMLGSADRIEQEVKDIIGQAGKNGGHIFNLGHGITPDVPPENVQVLVDAVHRYSQR